MLCLIVVHTAEAQTDSLTKQQDSLRKVPVDSLGVVATPFKNQKKVDSVLKNHSPRKAALRSALIPGWGQIYNKKYWKLPIVYGALGVSGGVFVYYLQTYKNLRFAYKGRIEALPKRNPITGLQIPGDSTNYNKISEPFLKVIDINALRSYRDEFRRDIDFSALAFILLWGINVVDATVDAHLKTFDVSPDLSFQFKFGHSDMAGTNGVSLVLSFK